MSTGEAKMIQQVLNSSKLLQKTDYIWKSTGRVFVKNADIVTNISEKKNYFLYSASCDSIQTWFFGVEKELLAELVSDKMINDMSNDCIEYSWMRYFRSHRTDFKCKRFKHYPDAVGIHSGGDPYTLSRGKLILKEILLQIGYFTVK